MRSLERAPTLGLVPWRQSTEESAPSYGIDQIAGSGRNRRQAMMPISSEDVRASTSGLSKVVGLYDSMASMESAYWSVAST
ncbi:hypothetical protein D3C84_832620 [compost metagenome]